MVKAVFLGYRANAFSCSVGIYRFRPQVNLSNLAVHFKECFPEHSRLVRLAPGNGFALPEGHVDLKVIRTRAGFHGLFGIKSEFNSLSPCLFFSAINSCPVFLC